MIRRPPRSTLFPTRRSSDPAGLLEPTSGTVDLLGVPPAIARRRKRIGFVAQDARLHPWRTVRQNVTLPLEVNRSARTNGHVRDRKSTRLNSSHSQISYAVFC